MKRFFKYTIPSILSMWVFALYAMVDGYFVANYVGETGFSAVNISMPVITSFFALGILLSIGTQAKAGFSLGRKNIREANEVFTVGFAALAVLGVIYTVLLYIFLHPLTFLLGANEQTYVYVKEYLHVLIFFGVFFMTTYQLEVLVKVDGFPQFATISVLVAALTNLVLDYLFIVPLQMGVFGAGLATGIAQVVSTLLLLFHFSRKKGRLNFVRKINLSHLKTVLPIGAGDALSEIAIGYTVFLFNTTLLKLLGQDGIVIYTVISYISVFAQVTMTGVAQGLAPLFSYDYGRRSLSSIRDSLVGGFTFITLITAVFLVIAYCFPLPVVDIFLQEGSGLRDSTVKALIKYSSSYLFIGYNIFMVTFFASLGKGRIAIFLSLLRTPILVTCVMFLYETFSGGNVIWYVLTFSEGLTTLVAAFFLTRYILLPLQMDKDM